MLPINVPSLPVVARAGKDIECDKLPPAAWPLEVPEAPVAAAKLGPKSSDLSSALNVLFASSVVELDA